LSAKTRSPILAQYNVMLMHCIIYLWSEFIFLVVLMSGNTYDPTSHPRL